MKGLVDILYKSSGLNFTASLFFVHQVEQLLNNVVNGINESISEESIDQLQLLTEKLRGLNRDELCHCVNHFGQDLVNDAELNEKRRYGQLGRRGIWGQGTQIFFGRYVWHRFSKVGSKEQVFSYKARVLGTVFLPKLVCLELKFCQNQREMGLKMLNFSKNGKQRA